MNVAQKKKCTSGSRRALRMVLRCIDLAYVKLSHRTRNVVAPGGNVGIRGFN